MIKKTAELMGAMRANPSARLSWESGSKPSAPGSYSLAGVRVYASAVNGADKSGSLKIIMNHWNYRVYRLTVAARMAKE